jgi:hypothetical protein
MPEGIVDRPQEVWEPLIAVADAAGQAWPELSRSACIELCRAAEDRRVSPGVRLLADLRTIFGDEVALHTDVIIDRLINGEQHGLASDAPWAEWHGRPIGPRQLANLVKPYGIASQKVTIHGRSLQGYRREHLWDAWSRYLPPVPGKAELVELVESDDPEWRISTPEIP